MKILLAFLFAACAAFAGSALAETVGNVGAVNQSAEAGGRKLSVGAGVAGGERITTNADGSAQIVFLDKSTMTIGHGSSVTINKFVYNGNQGVGAQSATLAKGALRFVGGAVSHSDGAKIETPSGSLSVRGGMAYVCLNCPEGTLFASLYGEVTLTNGRSTVTIPPGDMVRVRPDGSFSRPYPIPPGILATLDALFASATGQHGGASNPPSDGGVQLGNARMQDQRPWNGLDTLGAFWAGGQIVQSQSNANNQSSAATVRVLTTPHGGNGGNTPPCNDCNPPPPPCNDC
ncbi:MAG: FecR domain-containing protein [Methylocystis sp.]